MSVPTRFRGIVGGATTAAGAIGIPGAFSFGTDVPVLLGIWGAGATIIASESGLDLTKEDFIKLGTSALAGTACFVAGSKLAAKLFHLVPGPGTFAAIGVNSFLDAFFTYRFLRSVAKVFDRYDKEEITMQVLISSLSLFSAWTFIDDVIDMKECIAEGMHLKHLFMS